MKVTEWKRVVRPILPADEEWEFRGSMCYRLPVNRFLLGVQGEGSGFDKGIYIWRLTMPLFVPSRSVDLSWSERIGGGANKYDNLDVDAIKSAVGLAISGLGTEDDGLKDVVSKAAEVQGNRRVDETMGFAKILQGDPAAARDALARAAAGTARSGWEQEVIDRALLIDRLLQNEGSDHAVRQLDRWCEQTASALGLRRSVASDRHS